MRCVVIIGRGRQGKLVSDKKRFNREDVELEWKFMTPNFLSTIRQDLMDYKRSHGSYPNSLNRLSNVLILEDIYSPVDTSTHRHSNFYYKSQADTFILF